MIWYAFAISLNTRASSAGHAPCTVYREAPPAAPTSIRRFRFALVLLCLATSGILGVAFVGLAGRIGETQMSAHTSSRSPLCVIAQMRAGPDWAHKSPDYCAM